MAGKRLDLPETRRKVLDALRKGANDADAAMSAGIVYETLRLYLIECEGEQATASQLVFFATIAEARSHRHLHRLGLLNGIQDDPKNQAQLSALRLGFSMSGHLPGGPCGPSVSVDLGEDGRPTRIRASSGAELKELSDDELVVEHERLTKGAE